MIFGFSVRLPFDVLTPIGFEVFVLLQIFSYMLICHAVMLAFSLLISFFGMMMAFGHDLKRTFQNLNENYKTDRNNAELKNGFHEAIKLHIEVKELSKTWSIFAFTLDHTNYN